MRICGLIPESASTAARRRCGMQLTTDQSSSARWRSLLAGQTPRPVCGVVQISLLKSKSRGHPHLNGKNCGARRSSGAHTDGPRFAICKVTLASLRFRKGELAIKGGCTSSHEGAKLAASMQLNLGGMGLRDAFRVAVPAYWASWADCMPMIFKRHPNVSNLSLHELEGAREGVLGATAEARRAVIGVLVFDPPSWDYSAHGARPPPAEPKDMEPWSGRWQHVAASKVEYQHRESCSLTWGRSNRAHVRSQAGPGAGMAAPTHYHTRILPNLLRVVLLRRLRFPLPLSLHTCRCGRQIDKFGHHRASCARACKISKSNQKLVSHGKSNEITSSQ